MTTEIDEAELPELDIEVVTQLIRPHRVAAPEVPAGTHPHTPAENSLPLTEQVRRSLARLNIACQLYPSFLAGFDHAAAKARACRKRRGRIGDRGGEDRRSRRWRMWDRAMKRWSVRADYFRRRLNAWEVALPEAWVAEEAARTVVPEMRRALDARWSVETIKDFDLNVTFR